MGLFLSNLEWSNDQMEISNVINFQLVWLILKLVFSIFRDRVDLPVTRRVNWIFFRYRKEASNIREDSSVLWKLDLILCPWNHPSVCHSIHPQWYIISSWSALWGQLFALPLFLHEFLSFVSWFDCLLDSTRGGNGDGGVRGACGFHTNFPTAIGSSDL